MSDPIEFQYVNDSLTTLAQHRLISKLASYFKVPGKLMREMLNKSDINDGIVSFSGDSLPKIDHYHAVSIKLNVAELINPKKFVKSKFLAAFTLMEAGPAQGCIFTILTGSDLFVMIPFTDIDLEGGGGLYLSYPDLEYPRLVLPIETFLKDRHPLPLEG